MSSNPALEEFARSLEKLRSHALIAPRLKRGEVHLGGLELKEIAELARDDVAYYFLVAAANLNRTTLKKAMETESARIVAKPLRKGFAIKSHLPVRASFADVAKKAVVLRQADLGRRSQGAVEALFRERLAAEKIPILMSPPTRQVPGLLIGKRKPDGVFPDPAADQAPKIYLEIKNVRRVADDIQKRLYEIAEASLEMKFLYGQLELRGLNMTSTKAVLSTTPELRAKLRAQVCASLPVVVVLMLCSKVEAAPYKAGAEAFVDRVFFQEEIEECLAFLKSTVARLA